METTNTDENEQKIIQENYNYLMQTIYDSDGSPDQDPFLQKMKRIFGSVIGAFVGDAAGAYLEFSYDEFTQKLIDTALEFPGGGVWGVGAGQITDDSELAMCLLHGIGGQMFVSESKDRFDTPITLHSYIQSKDHSPLSLNLDRIQKYYQKWMRSPPFDIGYTTRGALGFLVQNQDPKPTDSYKQVLKVNQQSQSNGCLMRLTPQSVFLSQLSEHDMYIATRLETMFTHSNENAIAACYLYTFCISKLINEMTPIDAYNATKIEAAKNENLQKMGASDEMTQWFQEIEEDKQMICTSQIGYLKIAFFWAFYFLKKGTSYEEAINQILLKNGDTDTNAAIVGGLLGAQGINVIPKPWVEKVMSFNPTQGKDKNGNGIQRPKFLSPKHHLIPLTKALSLNMPTKLQVINENKLMNEKEDVKSLLNDTQFKL